VFAQEPVPPQVGLGVRCYYPGTVVLTCPAPERSAAHVWRQEPGGAAAEIGSLAPGSGLYYDTNVVRGRVYQYRVRFDAGRELGPVPGADSAEMLHGGDFEEQPAGTLQRTLLIHQAYGEPWWEIVKTSRPGGTGGAALRIRHGKPPRRDGLHSLLLPIDAGGTYRQSGWVCSEDGVAGALGRQILTIDNAPAGGRIVAYSYAPTVRESAHGWRYCEQRLRDLPKDAAYLQVWALAFNVRVDITFDDLSLVDGRTERLAAFDSAARLVELAELAGKAADQTLQAEAQQIVQQINGLEAELRTPDGTALGDYLARVARLDQAVQRAQDLIWDLKILALAR
jgi:hypothetical protein